ncbi:hypothetical protein [Cellulomonas sp. HZM]|uniref:hypothetical protein n=1 Tax=Cellulomonas sp. HZM TaxID=1454010 RepID=UPI0004933588|nr:hypothetical protein [Cellulomonas sp. HZM]
MAIAAFVALDRLWRRWRSRRRFRPAPGWPANPDGSWPGRAWQPPPEWPPAPAGWDFWDDDR